VEDPRGEGDQLGLAQHQQAVGPHGVVEAGEHLLLQVAVEIDEDVSAQQQVQPGDGGVGD
jgi:hypothetical protein